MRKYWIWLAQHPALNEWERVRLLEQFHNDPRAVYGALPSDAPHMEELLRRALSDTALDGAEQILRSCEEKGITLLTLADERYPRQLRAILDPPTVLYCRGSMPDLETVPAVSLVGTRDASPYGLRTARRMGWQAASCGAVVVSGLAAGVDGAAMEGALDAGGTVIGVVGGGVDYVYPKENEPLYRRTEEQGCILSEYPPGTLPRRWHFPKRNRIVSALASSVLVVEAALKSGSLITARLASEQGRHVFVVPANIDQPRFFGNCSLLRQGATPAFDGWDLLAPFCDRYPDTIRRSLPPMPGEELPGPEETEPAAGEKTPKKKARPGKNGVKKPSPDKKVIDKAPSGPYSDLNTILTALTPDQAAIVQCLKEGPRLADDIIAETGLAAGAYMANATMLEVKGLIKTLPGKRIILKETE